MKTAKSVLPRRDLNSNIPGYIRGKVDTESLEKPEALKSNIPGDIRGKGLALIFTTAERVKVLQRHWRCKSLSCPCHGCYHGHWNLMPRWGGAGSPASIILLYVSDSPVIQEAVADSVRIKPEALKSNIPGDIRGKV
ncbi:MAG: hypothetical protein A2V46_08610 [Bacteroidetes bacterium RBG_19FT_COMBO_42_7]|nr:MAG: hypothetical protein A2V46_08610 [Bacteroidetes bacterium RBG_19FT_COMBO_42_7]